VWRWRWVSRAAGRLLAVASRWVLKYHLATRVLRTVAIGLYDECRLDAEPFGSWADRTCGLVLIGWQFRAPVWFDKHAQVIREYFRPTPELCNRVDDVITRARLECDLLVGVHIRQGDYKDHLDGKFHYETAEYVQWMRRMQELMPDKRVGFLICSNVQQRSADFEGLCWTSPDGHIVVDMYSLAMCDYIVGPPSTFSQWASFYGQVPLCMLRERGQEIRFDRFEVFNGGMSNL
jgi:hypothetical protein